MHQHLLFAPVTAAQHPDVLAQLTGVAAMRPVRVIERHLIFKPFRRSTETRLSSLDLQSVDGQRLNKILNGAMHYIHAVGPLSDADFAGAAGAAEQEWEIVFNDTPIAGSKIPVNTRVTSTASLPYGDPLPFLNSLGFNYISEVLVFPGQEEPRDPFVPTDKLPALDAMLPLDSTGSYILQASLTVEDGADPDLIRNGADRLLALKDRLKFLLPLEPVDRLSLDTRAK
ncbi:Mediator of RNA polymerase II transcription subunit 18 [Ascosphaera pollenicola]|nr:Mediator of RNA polymerase II transcription subunit 18 [Ascosphaera pollenicola]